MSDSQEDAEKKKESSEKKSAEQSGTRPETASETQTPTQPKPKPVAPRVGTPIQQGSAPATSQTRPQVGTPVSAPRPSVGTPIGEQKPPTQAPRRPTVGTPVGGPRPTVGTSASTTGGATAPAPTPRPAVGSPRPTVSSPAGGTPATPAKPPESKQEISRRNFIKGLAILGGIVAVGQFVALGPYLQGSVGASKVTSQVINDLQTGAPIKTTDISENNWTTFVYPRTGNPNIDNDTFRQCVIIHLPKGWTAPSNLSAKDPISGDTFVALSRVCVHLWCLWSYVPPDERGECPCHGSQYAPGGPPGSLGATEPGIAVAGPAYLQTPPNNQLPVITLTISSDGTVSATGIVGQIGCGQKC